MLERTQYFIREHVGLLKLTDVYDILDPETKVKIGEAREEVGTLTKLLRLVINKSLMPTCITVYEGSDSAARKRVFSIRRGFTLLRSKIQIVDGNGAAVGYFQSKLLSLGGAFRVFDTAGREVALVKGDWKGWNFRFLQGETELGVVTKKWAGLGKELFTSADNYMISINGRPNRTTSLLLLAAGLAVDTVYKEKN